MSAPEYLQLSSDARKRIMLAAENGITTQPFRDRTATQSRALAQRIQRVTAQLRHGERASHCPICEKPLSEGVHLHRDPDPPRTKRLRNCADCGDRYSEKEMYFSDQWRDWRPEQVAVMPREWFCPDCWGEDPLHFGDDPDLWGAAP
ncbi:MAG: hypothetical protein WB679_05380 [Terracidiphilus sp.]